VLALPAAACGGDADPPGVTARAVKPPFAPDGVWNRPLPHDAPVDPRSRPLVAALAAQARGGLPATINTSQYSTPVYRVPRRQRRVRVTLDNPATYAASLRKAISAVPVPRDANPARGRDGHMVVWQPSTDTMWEFWKMRRAKDGWHAKSAGKMRRVSHNPGYFSGPSGFPWGATATSLPLLGGLMRTAELRRGRIDHALALAIPRPKAGVWAFPAQRTDGWARERDAIPEGARFRLDPDVDVARLHLPRPVRAMAEAAQRYGIIVRDFAGSVAFYAEDPAPMARNPYPAIFGGRTMQDALRDFPWDDLQLMEMDRRTYRGTGK
jgi:hypothetical protein